MERLRIIVSGLIAQHYSLAGVTWDYVQYLIGLHRMGHEVYYFEDSGEWPYSLDGGPSGDQWVAGDCRANTDYLRKLLGRYGLEDRWAYHFPTKKEWYGLSDRNRKSIMQSADLLINVSGTLEKPEQYDRIKRLAYIDTDPGFTQARILAGNQRFCELIGAHQVHFSFGERIPPHLHRDGLEWLPTRTPIVLDLWPVRTNESRTYTTVMSWTSYQPLVHNGITYRQKDAEFIKYLGLPARCRGVKFEIAMGKLQHANWQSTVSNPEIADSTLPIGNFNSPHDMLQYCGWQVVDPLQRCGSPDSYRDYIVSSRGEWSVAKGGYVTARPAWFSCRSACYLAAARPVIVQDTGFGDVLPVGEGILPFSTIEESVEAIEEVERAYSRHSAKAREIAGEYFEASRVLQDLVERAL